MTDNENIDADCESFAPFPDDDGERRLDVGFIGATAHFLQDEPLPELSDEEVDAFSLDVARARHPELNSALIKIPSGTVFLVVDGVALGFPNDTTFRRIHYRCFTRRVTVKKRNGGIGGTGIGGSRIVVTTRLCPRFYDVPNVDFIDVGMMDRNCRLRERNGTVFLIRSGFRHGISSPRAFNNYTFDWDDVRPWKEGTGPNDDGIFADLKRGVTLSETTGGRFDA